MTKKPVKSNVNVEILKAIVASVLWHEMPTDGNGIELTEDIYYKFPLSGEDETLSFEQLKLKYEFKPLKE